MRTGHGSEDQQPCCEDEQRGASAGDAALVQGPGSDAQKREHQRWVDQHDSRAGCAEREPVSRLGVFRAVKAEGKEGGEGKRREAAFPEERGEEKERGLRDQMAPAIFAARVPKSLLATRMIVSTVRTPKKTCSRRMAAAEDFVYGPKTPKMTATKAG